MKLLLLAAVCVIASLSVAVELAAKLEPIGIDFTAPITAADPGKAWKAVEIVATTLVAKTVPAECGMAVAVHPLVGLTKHLVINGIIEDLIHAGTKVGEMVRLQQMKVAGGTPAVMAAAVAVGRASPGMGFSSSVVDVAAHIKEVVATISAELEDKMAVFKSVIGTVHMEALFDDIHTLIDREVFLAKPVAELRQIVAITIQKNLVPFNAGLIKKLMITLPEVAEVLVEMVDAFQKEDLSSFFVSLLKEEADHLFHGIPICQVVEHASLDGRLTGFIDKMVTDGKISDIAKLILKINAMAMDDLELSPAEIKVVLTGMVDMVVGGTLPEVVYPQGKFFGLLVAIIGATASAIASVAG